MHSSEGWWARLLPKAARKPFTGAMSALVEGDNLREIAAKRELYRRLARASDDLRDVAERVWYSVLKGA
jgi:hypothetical protein